ncbi:MAG: hypothetical protein HYV37_03785 [Candidatus Levyibacteriota bacterium]|nr:MAG: hypothetical protein HYV37_03785 [Candidatus Levybacteria bacterium]
MNELPTAGNPETSRFPEFEYGRDLYVQLFKDDTPFVNLGYLPYQRIIAERALSILENDGHIRLTPMPCATFTGEKGDLGDAVYLYLLRHDGYSLHADVEVPEGGIDQSWILRHTFFGSEASSTVVEINMLPGDTNCEDLTSLVRHLYEEKGVQIGGHPEIHLEPDALLSRVKSALSSSTHQVCGSLTHKEKWYNRYDDYEALLLCR